MSMTPEPVERGPQVIAHCIRVEASAEELYAIIANPHRHHELDGSGTVRTTAIGPRELQPGDRFRVDMRKYGIPYAITMHTTRAQPHRVVEWRHPGGHRWRWELEPADDGGTLVTESYDFSGQAAPLRKALEIAGVHRENDGGIRASLQRLHDRFASS
ncbi:MULTISPECIES: SRPBCC family protein [unclassified Nesterenkonia]|uniref:SRPBCC family protein n=1 Tax=unclassified Nesterenkonia TaxID=2629769 RepID=UPI0009F6234B|nr:MULTISPECIES: SRPBCC family protein [unclassified Nesterenkonia]MDS2172809.1 SRPBCC family protein [Nesterenkonia sp. CL21]OSM42888.1 dimethyladenosine transferase [Nesterenkonia sp. PF2B19]